MVKKVGEINAIRRRRSGSKIKKLFIVLLFLASIVLTVSITLFFSRNLEKKDTTIFVEQIQELAMLATAEAKVTLVKEEVDHNLFGNDIAINLPGTKRKILLIIPATVVAGVDLQEVTSEKLKINEEKKELEIVVPRATFLQDPSVQMESVKTYSDKGLLSGEVKWDEGFDLVAVAQEEIEAEAIEMGLFETAEKNAEKVLKGFFSNLGYTAKITFE